MSVCIYIQDIATKKFQPLYRATTGWIKILVANYLTISKADCKQIYVQNFGHY